MSKRGMEIQGGADRYGGGGPDDAPMDTPIKATAAQMARRKIASVKGRAGASASRSVSPVKSTPSFGGGFGQSQPQSPQPQTSGFSFGQQQSAPAPSQNGFSFGQQAAPSTGGFTFGQSQPATSGSFTFGQSAAPPTNGGGFSFGANQASSFPPTNGTSGAAHTNGTSQSGQSPMGFSGSIFSFGSNGAQSGSNQQGGFGGTGTGSTNIFGKPQDSSSSMAPGITDEDRRYILEREASLTLEQAKHLESFVHSYLSKSGDQDLSLPLESIPADKQREMLNYLKSLPAAASNAPHAVQSLFGQQSRGRTQKPIVTAAQKDEIITAAQTLDQKQQMELIEIVKSQVRALKDRQPNEMPAVEQLPNDVQYLLWEFVKQQTADEGSGEATQSTSFSASGAQEKTNGFGSPAIQTPKARSTGFSLDGGSETKANDAEELKKNPFAAVARPSFTKPEQTPNGQAAPKPAFSFGSSTGSSFSLQKSTTAETLQSAPAQSEIKQTSEATPSKPTFSFGQPAGTPAFAVGKAKTPEPQTSGQTPQTPLPSFSPRAVPPAQAQGQASTSQPSSFSMPSQASTPSKTAAPFAFTPASQPSKPTQQQQPSLFSPAPKPSEAPTPTQAPTPARTDMATSSHSSSAVQSGDRSKARRLTDLQKALLQHLTSLNLEEDWIAAIQYYSSERAKIQLVQSKPASGLDTKTASATSRDQSASSFAGFKSNPTPTTQANVFTQHQSNAGAAPPSSKRKADEYMDGDADAEASGKRTRPNETSNAASRPSFSPSKPLSATASIFEDILQQPDRQSSPPKTDAASASSAQPPKFALSATSSAPAAPASTLAKPATDAQPKPADAPSFSMPKFGVDSQVKPASTPSFSVPKFGTDSQAKPASALSFSIPKFGAAQPGGNNFMSAFGAKAEKQAEKDKAKRKAEDFDSDDDDEEEWERQDREKQEAKKKELERNSKKVLKNVNGKFILVDPEESGAETAATTSCPQTSSASTSAFGGSTVSSQSAASGDKPANPFASMSGNAPSKDTSNAFANPFAHLTNGSSNGEKEGADEESDAEDDDDEDDSVFVEQSKAPAATSSAFSAPPAKSGGLFDRVEKGSEGASDQEKLAQTQQASNPFGFAQSVYGKSDNAPSASIFGKSVSSSNDNTWKPESPIKFGGAAPSDSGSTTPTGSPAKPLFNFSNAPKLPADSAAPSTPKFSFGGQSSEPATAPPKFNFGNSIFNKQSSAPVPATEQKFQENRPFAGLLGSKAPASSGSNLFANLKKDDASDKPSSTVGFQFGGPSASSLAPSSTNPSSRATTPGAQTDGEASAAGTDNEEEAPNDPQSNDLTALTATERASEDVLFEHKARCNQFIRNKEDPAASPWVNKGIGIIRLLQNKESGNVRIMMRQDPRGTLLLNHALLKDKSMYSLAGPKSVKMVFAVEGGALETFTATFGQPEKAKELLDKTLGVLA